MHHRNITEQCWNILAKSRWWTVEHKAVVTCRNVLFSISFSVARCSSPMCGSARLTVSPSRCNISRRTPWAAGCWGPKLIIIFLKNISLGLVVLANKFQHHKVPIKQRLMVTTNTFTNTMYRKTGYTIHRTLIIVPCFGTTAWPIL